MKKLLGLIVVILLLVAAVALFHWLQRPRSGHVKDEALLAGVNAADLKAAGTDDQGRDYFHDMDGGVALTPDEIKGRNTWLLWTAGNDRLWNQLSVTSFGVLDFLKTISSQPNLKANRENRWDYLGLVNEPCFVQATEPDPERYGLWLDKRDTTQPGCDKDPFEDESKYPGIKIGARGKNIPAGSY